MQSPTAMSLDPQASKMWENYKAQRVSELRSQSPNASNEYLTNIAWREFITLKWGLETDESVTGLNGIEYALRSYKFGPDLRGIPSFLRSFQ